VLNKNNILRSSKVIQKRTHLLNIVVVMLNKN